MMKISVLMLLAVCSVDCNVISTLTQKHSISSLLDVSNDQTSRTKRNVLNGCNNPTIPCHKAVDCADVLEMGYKENGIYQIWPISTPTHRMMEGKSLYVYCDMSTNFGGWTVIQRRGDFKRPKEYFYRNWETYKKGFGNIEEDFWFGNDKIFALTNQKLYSVRFDLKDVSGNKSYALYDEFWIDDEKRNYTLHIDGYSGDAGDSMEYINNTTFATFDKDNSNGCGKKKNSGWWQQHCSYSNLNGMYHKGKYENIFHDGVHWYHWKGYGESLEWTEIKIRPKDFRTAFS